jgi:hypothetical protein
LSFVNLVAPVLARVRKSIISFSSHCSNTPSCKSARFLDSSANSANTSERDRGEIEGKDNWVKERMGATERMRVRRHGKHRFGATERMRARERGGSEERGGSGDLGFEGFCLESRVRLL